MPAINQRIPNFLGGVSQQPDFIKFPGQLRTCHNAHPDVTFGLQKRPPGEYVGKLANAADGGQWFDIIRDNDEKYLVQVITSGSPTIRVWDLADGTEKSVVGINNGSPDFSYLANMGSSSMLKELTINDYTILTNPEKTVSTTRTTDTAADTNYGFISLSEIGYDTEYVVALNSPNLVSSTKYLASKLTVVKASTSSEVWHSSDTSGGASTGGGGSHTGEAMFLGDSSDGSWEGVGFTVQVSAINYIDDYSEVTHEFDNDGNSVVDVVQWIPNYRTRYTATVVLTDTGVNVGSSNISRTIAVNGVNYTVTITDRTTYPSYDDNKAAVHRTVKTIKKGQISIDTVLGALKTKLVAAYGNGGSSTVEDLGLLALVIGNGIYFRTTTPFNSISVKGGVTGDSLTAITSTAQNIAKLPSQCRDGYICKVANTDDSQADDYYVKFIADTKIASWANSTTYSVGNKVISNHNIYKCDTAGTSHATSSGPVGEAADIGDGTTRWDFVSNLVGAGVWEECAEPSLTAGFNYTTMPHALINYRNGKFLWTTLDPDITHHASDAPASLANTKLTNYWVDRAVGDDNTNPMPTFVGQTISDLFFVRNRLGIVSGEQIVISQPADYFNFFVNSAVSVSDADPIDMAASDVKPAFIRHVLPIQNGIMLFSEAAQFMLFTDSEVFGPKTAQIKKMSSYECSAQVPPVDSGTSVVFTVDKGSYTKVFEMIVQDKDSPPRVVEQTRVVPEYIPNDINDISNSSSNGLVTFGKLGTSDLYTYKYFDSGGEREQSSWYSWGIEGTLVHQLYTGGNYYTVTKQGSEWVVQRYELIVSSTSTRGYSIGTGTVGSPTTTSRRFEACLDNMVDRSQTTESYNSTTKKTTITYPYTIQNSTTNLRLVELVDGNVRTPSAVSGTTATYDNVDLTSVEFATGYKYTTEIGLPTYYYSIERGSYDTDADLRIHRLNFELGVSGPLEFHLTSPQINDYIHYESGIIADLSSLNKVPSQLHKQVSVPIYRKNDKYDMTVKIPAPFTTTLVSASWDGKFNTKRHVRR